MLVHRWCSLQRATAVSRAVCVRSLSEVVSSTADVLRVASIVRAFRNNGHMLASLDPLQGRGTVAERERPQKARELYVIRDSLLNKTPLSLGVLGLGHLSENAIVDVSKEVMAFNGPCTLRELVELLHTAYCGNVGIEYTHITGKAEKLWIRHRVEQQTPFTITKREKLDVLKVLIDTDELEKFMAAKFPSAKRFGLQGCDALLAGLFAAISRAVERGADEVELGMAHRGRLNVLAQVMQKDLSTIFGEFGLRPGEFHRGDVKYHLGTRCVRQMPRADSSFPSTSNPASTIPVQFSLSANPSHLEAVDPVVMGRARAVADSEMQGDVGRVMGLLIHGDASFSGQGIVSETLQLSALPDYTVGGMLHLVCNNQIGFTTAPHRSRSSIYCTDAAKTVGAPIFHVNADDAEAVVSVCRLAADWRSEWNQSACVDVVGYRRFGHNEQDNPMYTQPLMYKAIAKKKPVSEMFEERLVADGHIEADVGDRMRKEFVEEMERAYDVAVSEEQSPSSPLDWLASSWQADVIQHALTQDLDHLEGLPTGCDLMDLQELGTQISTIPEGFVAHKEIVRMMKNRRRMAEGRIAVDWAMAEALAFASILKEDRRIRLAGQDSERGTFNQRHAALYDQMTEARYKPIQSVAPDTAFRVVNSSLSEAAALGFEYGYSLTSATDLVLWEAQFGDFVNTAQSIVDTFLATGEHRWYAQSALAVLLPHGFEGQGPDHSSSRVERILQLCSDDSDNVPGSSPLQLAGVTQAFDAADTDNRGCLSRTQLMGAINTMSASTTAVSPVQARRILDALDSDGDGYVTRSEWQHWMLNWLRKEAALQCNMCVINPTTPANYFHALRRQVHRQFKKPLIVFTPKSLLHHKPCCSKLEDMGPDTTFLPVIGDNRDLDPASVRKVVLVSGKLFYQLQRSKLLADDIALVRLEELHPFPFQELAAHTIGLYPNATQLVWAQEELKNMGAWSYVAPRLSTMIRQLSQEQPHPVNIRSVSYVGPLPQPSPTASYTIHDRLMRGVVTAALTDGFPSHHSVVRSDFSPVEVREVPAAP